MRGAVRHRRHDLSDLSSLFETQYVLTLKTVSGVEDWSEAVR